jgi:hypothetical protein
VVDAKKDLLSTLEDLCRAGRDPYETLGTQIIAEVVKNAEPQNSIKFLAPEIFWPRDPQRLVPSLTTRQQSEPMSVISELKVTDDSHGFVLSLVCSGKNSTERLWVRWVSKTLPDRKCRFLCDRVLSLDSHPSLFYASLGEVRQVIKSALKIK